ncbi:MAG: glutamate racemase [Clostridia bacterium]|nr:glutamate racemase [Clostridia bacterium]
MQTGGIAFFDSGVGGLSVLSACRESVGSLPIYYFGDNARAPYGNRNIEDIRAYTHEAFSLFQRLGVAVAVVACNTVTAVMIDELRAAYPFPIIGIEPAVLPAARKGGRVLVLSTKATAESERLKRLIAVAQRRFLGSKIQTLACDRLAGEIETACKCGRLWSSFSLPRVAADRVVLGCTHYSLIKDRIADFYGAEVFDGNVAVANRLKEVIAEQVKNRAVSCEKSPQSAYVSLSKKSLRNLRFFVEKRKGKLRRFLLKKEACFWKVRNAQSLYFLGSGRIFNRQFYERMFAFKQ